MKKGLLVLVPALFLSLTACDLSSLANQFGGDDNDDETSEEAGNNSNGGNQGSDDDAIFDKTESIDKLMAFGKDTGFEITTSSSESDSANVSTFTIGMKGNVWWTLDGEGYGSAYRLEGSTCSMLSYDDATQTWSVLVANVGETQYVEMFNSVTSYLYTANEYFANDGFVSNGSGKYAGRDVLKYKYHRGIATYSADHEFYVDKDLGITIYDYVTTTSDGETSWVKVETTSFKTGSAVSAITVA